MVSHDETPRHTRLQLYAVRIEVTRHSWASLRFGATDEQADSVSSIVRAGGGPEVDECVAVPMAVASTSRDAADYYVRQVMLLIESADAGLTCEHSMRLAGDMRTHYVCGNCGRRELYADQVAPVHEPRKAVAWMREALDVTSSDIGYTADGHMAGNRVACATCIDDEYGMDASEVVPAAHAAWLEQREELRREGLWTDDHQWSHDRENAGEGVL